MISWGGSSEPAQAQDSAPVAWSVAILHQPYSTFTYLEPPYLPSYIWRPGLRVLVPMGKGDALRSGVLMRSMVLDSWPRKIKNIFFPLEREPLLDPDYLELLEQVAYRQLASPGRVLAYVLPGGFRKVPPGWQDKDKNRQVSFPSPDKQDYLAEVSRLWLQERWVLNFSGRKTDPLLCVAKDPPWPIQPRAKLQWAVMDLLWDRGAMPRSMLRTELGHGAPKCLQSLQAKGLIREVDPEENVDGENLEPCGDYQLSPDQREALESLGPRLEEESFHASVLHGITGSGKSLVYLHLARQCLQQGRSVILLAPEIAIARQLYGQARQFLPGATVILHHGLKGARQKEDTFLKIRNKQNPMVLVGTRSALFMPVRNIGLIVLDEEHDEAFKQDQTLIYQAKEVAYYLAAREKSLLVLGSATPDIKTYHAASKGYIDLVGMESRVGGSNLPQVDFVDLKEDPPEFGPLAGTCARALQEALSRGEQAVIMHNRRGYSPILMCVDCSEIARCRNCQVGLTYHKKRNRLVCHYCGESVPYPPVCGHCRGSEFVPVGQGTEKVEEFLARHLPEYRVLRLDKDSTRHAGRAEQILQSFASGNAQVLVGTQMLSKGHSFPDVTLAVVLDADLGLGLPDYRSTERTFQLLVQLSGRAGRGEKVGRVFIQTRNPGHYCWEYIKNCDYLGFYRQEIRRRQEFGYPPFVRLGLIRFSFPSGWEHKADFMSELRRRSRQAAAKSGVTLLGPAPAVLSKLKNRERYQFLVKSREWTGIKELYLRLWPVFTQARDVRVSLDLDPVSML